MTQAPNQPLKHSPTPTWHPLAGFCAWLVPGLGHILIGERRRGTLIMLTIMLLWFSGWLIGGISTFDRKDHPAWFWAFGQAYLAPALLVDAYQQRLKSQGQYPPRPDMNPTFEPSFGRTNELAILYTAIAGLLNLLAIIDVVYRDGRRRGGRKKNQGSNLTDPTLAALGAATTTAVVSAGDNT